MKIIGIDGPKKETKKIDKNKLKKLIIIAILSIIAIILICLYVWNKPFRETIDKYVFMKNVEENKLTFIALDSNNNYEFYAYDKYICVFDDNKLIGYNSSGNKEYELAVELTNPLIDKNDKYMLMAEKDKQKIYLICENEIVWEKELEGNISRVSVNKNGYVSVVLTGTTYKSIIQVFDNNGKSMFRTYLSSSIVMDTSISNDNRYLSFAEIGTNGTSLQTRIKTISMQKAQETPSEAIISTIKAPNDEVVLNIKYQDGNRLICMYDNSISSIQNNEEEVLLNLNEEGKKSTFADVELNNSILRISEKSGLLSTESNVELMNTGNKIVSNYTIDGSVKEIYTYNNFIALNLGSEVHFINNGGWLSKKYMSSQEVRKILLADSFAGIVYRDKIEIIEL